MHHRIAVICALLCASVGPLYAGPIEDLQPGHWYMVPNSRLEDVFPNPVPPGDPANVVDAWSGGAYDTQRDRLIVWGGGHGDYSGNEVYAFDVNTLSWLRLTNPSPDVGGSESSGYYPDGKPRSRHTYEYVEYLGPPFDRFCSVGGHGLYPSGQIGIGNFDCFSPATLQWQRYANTPTSGIAACAAYDPVNKRLWAHHVNNQLAEFNPSTNTWTTRSSIDNDIYYCAAEIDPIRRRFMAFGGWDNHVHASWNIDGTGTLTRTNLATTGNKAIENEDGPGLAYDPVSDKMVGYIGGANVYTLNLTTLVWTLVTPAPTNTVTPGAEALRGTYGRFRYMPSKNAFIVVNGTDENVYIYKLSSGGGSPPDAISPARTSDLRPR